MLLAHDEIEELLDLGVVEYAEPEHINATSLDVRLGIDILIERPAEVYNSADYQGGIKRVTLRDRDPLTMRTHNLMKDGPFILYPGEFILAHTHEVFHLPNHISAQYALKSSMARIGLEHLNAGWCDAGWNNSSLTLELKNITRYHEIVLHHLDKIGQLIFFKHKVVKDEHSYASRGRYNGDRTVSGAKVDPRVDVIVEGDPNDEEHEREFKTLFNAGFQEKQ